MKKLGYLLIVAGFLAGALVSVLDDVSVDWTRFSAAMILGVVGIVLVRLDTYRMARTEGAMSTNLQMIDASLDSIVQAMQTLNAEKAELDVYDVHRRIDELVPDHLTRFVEARSSIANAFGLQGYADVMSHFAAGERYLNRVWSASADGYVDEVREYLGRAEAQFIEARDLLRRLERR